MLVTFRTQAYADITLFGDVAIRLLNLMGHSGTVPGAILAEDVPVALERLKRALDTEGSKVMEKAEGDPHDQEKEDEARERPISLATHAFPLLQLLSAAAQRKVDVMWNRK